MPQQFVSPGLPVGLACCAYNTGAGQKAVYVQLPIPLDWQTAPAETLPDTVAGVVVQALAIPANVVSVDVQAHTWLLVTFVGAAGAAHPLILIDQTQLANIDTLLTGAPLNLVAPQWAILGTLVADTILDRQQ